MKQSKLLLTYMPAPKPSIITAHDLRYFEPCYCSRPKIGEQLRTPNCLRCNDTGYIGVQSVEVINE